MNYGGFSEDEIFRLDENWVSIRKSINPFFKSPSSYGVSKFRSYNYVAEGI